MRVGLRIQLSYLVLIPQRLIENRFSFLFAYFTYAQAAP